MKFLFSIEIDTDRFNNFAHITGFVRDEFKTKIMEYALEQNGFDIMLASIDLKMNYAGLRTNMLYLGVYPEKLKRLSKFGKISEIQ